MPAPEGADDPLGSADYLLPEELVAGRPPLRREDARLLVLEGDSLHDQRIPSLVDRVRPGDLVVANDTRVMHARLRARRATGGTVEVLLLGRGPGPVEAMVRPSRRMRPGELLTVDPEGAVEMVEPTGEGTWLVRTDPEPPTLMDRAGHVPIPPYLGRDDEPEDRERYQTVWAGPPGAVAAPTAGLHLTPELVLAIRSRGARFETITLHVGAGTFRNLRPEDLERGRLHAEEATLPARVAQAVDETRDTGGRVLAIGTTTVRTLETFATGEGRVRAGSARTDLFIRPGYAFGVVDLMLTNFHLPRSSLLLLVQAFGGVERVRRAYEHAVVARYRFYSYGDAMLVDRAGALR